ncbi:MAG: aminomethyl-transferring glycine dehydrogenase [Actinobacteria bacterium]|nr:aminomethyl-transferring glycine dehydrogenase [Actinomycetota bacterium]
MLAVLGNDTLDALIDATVPKSIRQTEPLRLRGLDRPDAEDEVLAALRDVAAKNHPLTSLIGQGYYGTVTPPVILRNVLENPSWYTAYTPYQPEISQGRLEALLNFQTMVADLTGLPLTNASLLDEGTAAAEAMSMARRAVRGGPDVFLVDTDVHPQTLAVLQTRAEPSGIEVRPVDPWNDDVGEAFGLLMQYPGTSGEVRDLRAPVQAIAARGGLAVVAADPLALTLLTSPGEQGADIVVGSTQRFGVPMWFGGPHAAYIATRDDHKRSMPGRIVGVSVDTRGRMAHRLALQTREQHIRRERATSNICTAQVLLAVAAGFYAIYHGPEGLTDIAEHCRRLAETLKAELVDGGVEVETATVFDTLTVRVPHRAAELLAKARAEEGLLLRRIDDERIGIAFDETSRQQEVEALCRVFGVASTRNHDAIELPALPGGLARTSDFMTHPVFHEHRSETAMMRYVRHLASLDLALDRTMIPLGSCTMKLNAAVELEAISWHRLQAVHPFAPADTTVGSQQLVRDVERWLADITGYDAVSVQPNAGSQGELAGLLAIRGYHRSRGDTQRTVCLIPSSAHGTNAASAVMAGMRVVVVDTSDGGQIDLEDLRAKAAEHADTLAAIMVTYPSTFGVFEAGIVEVCEVVHEHGGQVYLDGANLNALVGLGQPGRFGADVSHLNLHKTFCIPHGGGGPGVGPVAARAHLAPFLPGSSDVPAISAAPHGSAGILPIPWAYIRLMGAEGLTDATRMAILNANYIAARLADAYPVVYTGEAGTVAHEAIIDLREITRTSGVTAEDVAKRLIDHGFHAPTMSFPVAGTLMVEPTESEPKDELDRFVDAMLAIRDEIAAVEAGEIAVEDSPLRRAPHPAEDLLTGEWDRRYTREEAAYPVGVRRAVDKYWPPVSRIDNAYGDKNLVCSCPPVDSYDA